MKAAAAGVRQGLLEGRKLWSTLLDEQATPSGGIVVSGMLAEQLVRELGPGAAPGTVFAREGTIVAGAEVVVRVIAGDPSNEDVAVVRAAEREGVPVVLVQLWPQAEWTRPFVLTPFVVECRAGEGFPVNEIAGRIAEAAEHAPALAARVPVLRDVVESGVVRGATIRSALLAARGSGRGGTRSVLALEQVRALSRLRALDPRSAAAPDARAAAGVAALLYASSYGFRGAARLDPPKAAGASRQCRDSPRAEPGHWSVRHRSCRPESLRPDICAGAYVGGRRRAVPAVRPSCGTARRAMREGARGGTLGSPAMSSWTWT